MAKSLRMHQIKRIIELQQQGRGIRQTVRLTGLSRNTIREYLRRISTAGLTLSQAFALDDEALSTIVYTDAVEKRTAGRSVDDRFPDLESKLDHYCAELRKRGVTKQLLWEEYRGDYPNGYGYTQFCEYIKHHIQIDEAVMHFVHRPGETLQNDFAGGKLGYVEPSTGEWVVCDVLHNTINRFRSDRLKDVLKTVFGRVVELLIEAGHLSLKEIFTDGTKNEAQANRYTFVWGNAIKTSKARMEEQLKELWAYAEGIAAEELKNEIPETFVPVSSERVSEVIDKIDKALEGNDISKKSVSN
jgi:lambda repressor-like predicted transcriptional regulator